MGRRGREPGRRAWSAWRAAWAVASTGCVFSGLVVACNALNGSSVDFFDPAALADGAGKDPLADVQVSPRKDGASPEEKPDEPGEEEKDSGAEECEVLEVRGREASSAGAGAAWFQAALALEPGDGVATASGAGSISDDLQVYDFDMEIPSRATVKGVELRIRRSASRELGVLDEVVTLQGSGGAIGGNRADTTTHWPTTLTDRTYGNLTDLWGKTALVLGAELIAASLRVVIRVRLVGVAPDAATAQIDDVLVRVAHCRPP